MYREHTNITACIDNIHTNITACIVQNTNITAGTVSIITLPQLNIFKKVISHEILKRKFSVY